MSQLEVDKIIPQSGTTLTIGDSGDTITIASGATLSGDLNASNLTSGTVPDARITGDYTGITSLKITSASSGVTPNASGDELLVEGSANSGITIGSGTSGVGSLFFADSGDDNRGSVQYLHSSDDMRFMVNGNSEKARIDSSGRLQINTTGQTSFLNVNSAHNSGVSAIKTLRLGDTAIRQHWTLDNDNGNVAYFATNGNSLVQNANANLIFQTGATERMRIHSNGVGIGTSSPGEALDVVGNAKITSSTNHPNLHIRSTITPNGSKTGGQLNLSLGTGSNSGSGNTSTQVGDILGAINFNGQGTDYSFQAGAIEVKQTTPIGQTNRSDAGCDMIFKVIPAGNTSYQEKLRIKSSGGICFNGDTSVNNALDDYEQGTFTPSFSSGVSGSGYTHQTGRYTKIGNKVFIEIQLDGNGLSGNGDHLKIGNLPFSSIASAPYGAISIGYNAGFVSDGNITIVKGSSNNVLECYQRDGTSLLGNETNNINQALLISGQYTVA